MLREDEREGAGAEVLGEFEDVGEGGAGHGEEDVLHVDDEEDCGHDGRDGQAGNWEMGVQPR